MKEREGVTLSAKLKDKGFKFNEKTFDKAKKMAEASFRGQEKDARFWEAKKDTAGNAYAIIRFLPDRNLDAEFQIFEHYQHFFLGKSNKWLVENCPTVLAKPCPICEANSILWKTEVEANKAIARKRKRNLHRICNILVIKDAAEPENEGKVFLFEIPYDVHKKIMDKLKPKFDFDSPMNVFNPLESSEFKMKISTNSVLIDNVKRAVRDFSESSFSDKLEPLGDDKKIDEVWKKCIDLNTLREEKKYKINSYEEIKKAFIESQKVSGMVETGGADENGESAAKIKDVKELLKKEETVAKEEKAEKVSSPEDEEIEKGIEGITEGDIEDEEIKIDADTLFA